MILVVGATGLLGARICERLRAEGQPVRALIRRTSNPHKVNVLKSLGCELATGDLKDPPQIQAACQGISAVVSTASSTISRQPGDSIESVDLQGQLALVNAARSGGIRRFVFVSFPDDPSVQHPLTRAKRSVERAIADLDFTSIQASYFMEVWLSPALAFDYNHGRVRIYGDGSKPISWVSYRDVAEFCIAPVLRSVASRSVLAVGGPEALTPLEVVKIFKEESGQGFDVETVPEARLREQFDSATDSLKKSFAGIMLRYAHGDAIDMAGLLESIPVRLTTVRQYARTVLETSQPAPADAPDLSD
ncbi:MAG: SDR family oxidoreductase [Verrucomicrobia bacterium]|nr:SDR family oxidoreductase [Verrucomicrobiota bacterium]